MWVPWIDYVPKVLLLVTPLVLLLIIIGRVMLSCVNVDEYFLEHMRSLVNKCERVLVRIIHWPHRKLFSLEPLQSIAPILDYWGTPFLWRNVTVSLVNSLVNHEKICQIRTIFKENKHEQMLFFRLSLNIMLIILWQFKFIHINII